MNLYVGTSGYSYKEWKGSFYPEDLPAKGFLRYYGERFRTCEINNTFYRIPKTSVMTAWAAEVPEGFRFVLKAPQRITHFQRLKNSGETVEIFFRVAAELGERLGPVLFQLPPNLKKDGARLKDFLELLPKGARVAFEFRHESWFDDETWGLLKGRNAALCIAEAEEGEGVEVPFEATADWGYIRLRKPEYSDADLKAWIKRTRGTTWKDAFVFFKHEDAGVGPALAKKFVELAKG
jgi:uncharacterized protein YecE (DUF72 family)